MTAGSQPNAAGAVEIEVSVPAMLRDCIGGRSRVSVTARTLTGAIDALIETHPLLRLHLYQEDGQLRPHILLYLNDENTAWLDPSDTPLRPGDRITVLQNVSGG